MGPRSAAHQVIRSVPVKALSGAARRHLRALGHHLQPVVQCGKEGVSDALVAAANAAIDTHELIKVRISENADGDRRDLAAAIAAATRAELVGVLGRTVLLYRRHPKKPVLQLPKKGAAAKANTAKALAAPVANDGDRHDDLADDDAMPEDDSDE
jgi:RNA-binding protein